MVKSVTFNSAGIYIESATSIKDKLTRVNAIITALLDVAIKAAETGNINEYQLDSGQTKIRTNYTGPEQVFKSIQHFERLKTYYENKLNGHSFRLMDAKNFIPR